MIIRPQKVQVNKLSKDMKVWYQEKGYDVRSRPLFIDIDDLKQKSNIEVYFECDYCGDKNGKRSYKRLMESTHHLCGSKTGRDCVKLFKQAKNEEKLIKLNCEYCGQPYTCKPSQFERLGSRFCKMLCRNKWESENKRGKNHHNYNSIEIPCDYCGTIHPVKKHRVESEQEYFFCKAECRIAWYSEVWSQSDEWREESRKRAVRLREEGRFKGKGAANKPESIIIQLLQDLGIHSEQEKAFRYYSSDNYLTEHNLSIEVNGTYWHCDPRVYDSVIYPDQAKRIVTDVDKEDFLKTKYGIKTLYLWEADIENDLKMCEALIKEYVKYGGKVPSNHSFNYGLIQGDLKIINDIQPYKDTSSFEIIRPEQNKGYTISPRSELDERQVLEALVLIDKIGLSAKELENCLDMKPKVAQGLVYRPDSYIYARETYTNMSPSEKRELFIKTIRNYDITHKRFKDAQALTAKEIFTILDLIEKGAPVSRIARRFNLGSSSIMKIKNMKIYQSVIKLYQILKTEYPEIAIHDLF
jgi:hypothetical protein